MTKTKKRPSYLPIYDLLYDEIMRGEYSYGEAFPSENELSKLYDVSRNTLRQALAILQQDGLIHKSQGKGAVVTYSPEHDSRGKYYNFLREDALEENTGLFVEYNYGLPTHIAKRKLQLEDDEEVLASNNVYRSGDEMIGQSFIQIPVKVLEEQNIDRSSEEELTVFMDKGIYKLAHKAEISVQLADADEQVVPYLCIETGTALLYIEQLLIDKTQRPVARIKYYLCSGKHQIQYKW